MSLQGTSTDLTPDDDKWATAPGQYSISGKKDRKFFLLEKHSVCAKAEKNNIQNAQFLILNCVNSEDHGV